MSEYANNIPTTDKPFTPMGPSEIPSIIADIEVESPYAEDDPARPVDDLIKRMLPQREFLMAILRASAQRPTMDEIKAVYDEIWEFRPTVFSAYDLCVLLEETGAIERVTSDGKPYDMASVDPIVVEDEKTGAVYYQANEPTDMHWSLLPAGQTILDDDDPVARAEGFFEADENLKPLFKRVLTLCDCEEGADIEALNDAVNYDDLVWEPRLYAPFFVDRMEKADAIAWKGSWKLTEAGRDILALLDDVEDDYDPAVQAANKAAYLASFESDEPEEEVEFEGVLIDQDALLAASTDEERADFEARAAEAAAEA